MQKINARNHINYAFSDTDILTVVRCLEKRDNKTLPDNITLGAAISDPVSTPPGNIIKPLIEEPTQLPHTIYLPYKVIHAWHWNIAKLHITDTTITCCCYNTDGNRYPMETALLDSITPYLGNRKIINLPQKEHFPSPGQLNINCGLICALMVYDLMRDQTQYAGYLSIIENPKQTRDEKDTTLRNAVSELVEKYGDQTQKDNFCRPTASASFDVLPITLDFKDAQTKKILTMLDKLEQEDSDMLETVLKATDNPEVSTTTAIWSSLRPSSPRGVNIEPTEDRLAPLFEDDNKLHAEALNIVTYYKQQQPSSNTTKYTNEDMDEDEDDNSYDYIEDLTKNYTTYTLIASAIVIISAIVLALSNPIGWVTLAITAGILLTANILAYYADNKKAGHEIGLKEAVSSVLSNPKNDPDIHNQTYTSEEAKVLQSIASLDEKAKQKLAKELTASNYNLDNIKSTLRKVTQSSSKVAPLERDIDSKVQEAFNSLSPEKQTIYLKTINDQTTPEIALQTLKSIQKRGK